MSKLLNGMKKTANRTVRTENGALSNKSSMSDVLDFYYHAPARRGQDNTNLFAKAYMENPLLALKALFYIRDIRGGGKVGERETFRQCLKWLYGSHTEVFAAIVPIVAEYGRWDDLLRDYHSVRSVRQLVSDQLRKDMKSERPSLLGKWMPSENASSKQTRELAHAWMYALELSPREYRTMLTKLRKHIRIVETQMSANKWNEIEYSIVPSKASMVYRKAFHKHDHDRYQAFIEAANKGQVKINSGTLYPYELVSKYLQGYRTLDATIEAQWKQLPNFADTDRNMIVVCDVSGSMMSGQLNQPRPIDVSISLAIYAAERNKGMFKDHFITFSERPTLQQIKGNTLRDKVHSLSNAHWQMNTNLQAVFDLILNTARQNHLAQEDMPEIIFIVSDMQFDSCVEGKTNHDVIQTKYQQYGYNAPKLVFWNVNSRVTETPVTMYDTDTFLVAGCSGAVFKQALNAKASNPYDLMVETLSDSRYDAVEQAFNNK